MPITLQGRQRPGDDYKAKDFKGQPANRDLDEQPTRDRPSNKENQKNKINIDESEDTFHNQDELQKILARGMKLRNQMDEALDSDAAWEALHGPHAVPKKYVPPFLAGREETKRPEDEHDRILELEIEASDPRNVEKGALEGESKLPESSSGVNIGEMKFIKVKILDLRVENEALLHELIDQTFTMNVEVPLPDLY